MGRRSITSLARRATGALALLGMLPGCLSPFDEGLLDAGTGEEARDARIVAPDVNLPPDAMIDAFFAFPDASDDGSTTPPFDGSSVDAWAAPPDAWDPRTVDAGTTSNDPGDLSWLAGFGDASDLCFMVRENDDDRGIEVIGVRLDGTLSASALPVTETSASRFGELDDGQNLMLLGSRLVVPLSSTGVVVVDLATGVGTRIHDRVRFDRGVAASGDRVFAPNPFDRASGLWTWSSFDGFLGDEAPRATRPLADLDFERGTWFIEGSDLVRIIGTDLEVRSLFDGAVRRVELGADTSVEFATALDDGRAVLVVRSSTPGTRLRVLDLATGTTISEAPLSYGASTRPLGIACRRARTPRTVPGVDGSAASPREDLCGTTFPVWEFLHQPLTTSSGGRCNVTRPSRLGDREAHVVTVTAAPTAHVTVRGGRTSALVLVSDTSTAWTVETSPEASIDVIHVYGAAGQSVESVSMREIHGATSCGSTIRPSMTDGRGLGYLRSVVMDDESSFSDCRGDGSLAVIDVRSREATDGYCGNGIVEPGEACDDGSGGNRDGCVGCAVEPGYACPTTGLLGGACRRVPTITSMAAACVTLSSALVPTSQALPFVELPFVFPLLGEQMSQVSVHPTGYVQLTSASNATPPSSLHSVDRFPDVDAPNGIVAPFWDGWFGATGTNRGVRSLSQQNERRWIAEWNVNHTLVAPSTNLRFQLMLYATGVIEFHYCDTGMGTSMTTGSRGSAGIESSNGAVGLSVFYMMSGTATPGRAYRLTP